MPGMPLPEIGEYVHEVEEGLEEAEEYLLLQEQQKPWGSSHPRFSLLSFSYKTFRGER